MDQNAKMSKDHIDQDTVRKVAALARLELTADELQSMQKDLDSILGYVQSLDKLDVSNVPTYVHASQQGTRLRADKPEPSLLRDEALAAAPATHAGGFAVPKVLDGGN